MVTADSVTMAKNRKRGLWEPSFDQFLSALFKVHKDFKFNLSFKRIFDF